MKISGQSIFVNHSFTHQLPGGPEVTIEMQTILYPHKNGGYGYDAIDLMEISEIEIMGTKLSTKPEVEDSTARKGKVSAIRAYCDQMRKMGLDVEQMTIDAYEAELKKFTDVNQVLEGTGIKIEGDTTLHVENNSEKEPSYADDGLVD